MKIRNLAALAFVAVLAHHDDRCRSDNAARSRPVSEQSASNTPQQFDKKPRRSGTTWRKCSKP